VLYGDDGYRGDPNIGNLQDTQRNEVCMPTATYESGIQISRCLPVYKLRTDAVTVQVNWYSDSSCTQAVVSDSSALYFDARPEAYPYVADVDSSGNVTAIYPATVEVFGIYSSGNPVSPSCQPGGSWGKYILGAQIPLSDFVKMQVVAE
jgi:hypothetical protein